MTPQEQITKLIKVGNYWDSTDAGIAHTIIANINSGKIVPERIAALLARADAAEAKLAKGKIRYLEALEMMQNAGTWSEINAFLKENQP